MPPAVSLTFEAVYFRDEECLDAGAWGAVATRVTPMSYGEYTEAVGRVPAIYQDDDAAILALERRLGTDKASVEWAWMELTWAKKAERLAAQGG